MKIVSLMDNVAVADKYVSSHGLSFYIEMGKHKILFDAGPDAGFLENAKLLGIDLSQVDMAVLSHGHYDHGGGLEAFCQVNEKAKIHVQKRAFARYFAHDPDSIRYIGLPESLKDSPRMVLHQGDEQLAPGISLFAGVTGRKFYSTGNDSLYMEMGTMQIPDLFTHEQNLLLTEGDHTVLLAGCAHNGIVNILEKAKTIAPKPITCVVGGMHLMKTENLDSFAKKLAGRLKEESCTYYTCHCTSVEGFHAMQNVLGKQIHYFAAGGEMVV